jgi:putative nucleotidyltransferase with HDIG domain
MFARFGSRQVFALSDAINEENSVMTTATSSTFCGIEMTEVRRLTLEKLFSKLSDVASFPATAQRLLELTNDENADGAEIREVIQTDPALVANILKRANSAYYSLANKVTDIRSALSVLGMREIRNMATTIFLTKFSEAKSDHGTYRRQALWDHSVAVGLAAKFLSKQTGKGVPEEAYMAGLLHDIGYILCDQFLNKHFRLMIDQLQESVATPDIENQLLTFDHAMLGGFVAQKWKFPESAVHAITFHHKPHEYQGEYGDTLNIVVLANYLCSQAGYLSLGVNNALLPEAALLNQLGLQPNALETLPEQLQDTLKAVRAVPS